MQLQVLERDEEQAAETASPFPVPSAVPDPGRHSLVFKLAVVLAFVVGGAFYVLLLYAASIHAAPGNSDGATVILEGRALSAGNLTLKHWALSMDSFWLVDVPLYAIGVLLVGVRPELLHLVPSIVAFAVISVGAWIARFGRRGWAAALAVGALVVLLGLPNRALAANFLMGPLHVTTVLWCLGAFVALRNGRYGWGWLLGVGLLAVGLLGDMQAAMLGTIPVFLAGLAGALRKRNMRVGLPAASAAIASAIAAEVLRHLALAIGTFSIARANPRAPVNQMIVNLRGLLGYGAALAGVGIKPFSSASEPAILFIAHAIGLVVLVVAVCLAAVAVLRAERGRAARQCDSFSCAGTWSKPRCRSHCRATRELRRRDMVRRRAYLCFLRGLRHLRVAHPCLLRRLRPVSHRGIDLRLDPRRATYRSSSRARRDRTANGGPHCLRLLGRRGLCRHLCRRPRNASASPGFDRACQLSRDPRSHLRDRRLLELVDCHGGVIRCGRHPTRDDRARDTVPRPLREADEFRVVQEWL